MIWLWLARPCLMLFSTHRYHPIQLIYGISWVFSVLFYDIKIHFHYICVLGELAQPYKATNLAAILKNQALIDMDVQTDEPSTRPKVHVYLDSDIHLEEPSTSPKVESLKMEMTFRSMSHRLVWRFMCLGILICRRNSLPLVRNSIL